MLTHNPALDLLLLPHTVTLHRKEGGIMRVLHVKASIRFPIKSSCCTLYLRLIEPKLMLAEIYSKQAKLYEHATAELTIKELTCQLYSLLKLRHHGSKHGVSSHQKSPFFVYSHLLLRDSSTCYSRHKPAALSEPASSVHDNSTVCLQ